MSVFAFDDDMIITQQLGKMIMAGFAKTLAKLS